MVGYTKYVELVRPFLGGKKVATTGMTREIQRVEKAVELALTQGPCALVCSGDPGVYALAGLVFEVCIRQGVSIAPFCQDASRHDGLYVEIVPGIPALCAGAALLGAPIGHDFAVVSLSDRLTVWNLIERRLDAAARADFVIVLYNPRSKGRTWQLGRAREILLRHRSGKTPVGIVGRAMRDGQRVSLYTLDTLDEAVVDMETTVFVGNNQTFTQNGLMVTPRGYRDKYDLGPGGSERLKQEEELE